MRWFALLAVAGVLFWGTGCGGGKLSDSNESAELPEGHPPVADDGSVPGGRLGSDAPTDADPLPLKLKGLNSLEELKKGEAGTDSQEARESFVAGFRKTYTADASKRDYAGAQQDLGRAVELDPNYAEAHRALGYARFNMGFNVQAALDAYLKAVELKPDYGEAHYALAFMYAMTDLEAGGTHFEKAMELGIADESDLRGRYYSKE